MHSDQATIKLSVNVNKIAWLRNARAGERPNLSAAVRDIIAAGAHGITVHPRPDQRHITAADTKTLAGVVRQFAGIEYNIEGNPRAGPRKNGYPGFDALIEFCRPDQCTLVPDSDGQLTSDHGFNLLVGRNAALMRRIRRYQAWGARVSLFMDPVPEQINAAADCGADRIELYTGPYAEAFGQLGENHPNTQREFARYAAAAEHAATLGLGVNAGHDLDQNNLPLLNTITPLAEVSIGHALVADALEVGLHTAVQAYLAALSNKKPI